ncbi:unnamed protein product [Oppiella nova]|uniref:Uncharacterized protein n=1 Tax=Oppiella nova TaxID=334625 RepID=A0A7R9QWU7_9ACAR|nr:unnamed protein product [Oppiella nova]CAG2176921.1 unnamed protein product [Oppiella nova]
MASMAANRSISRRRAKRLESLKRMANLLDPLGDYRNEIDFTSQDLLITTNRLLVSPDMTPLETQHLEYVRGRVLELRTHLFGPQVGGQPPIAGNVPGLRLVFGDWLQTLYAYIRHTCDHHIPDVLKYVLYAEYCVQNLIDVMTVCVERR